ncbi:MAG: hypothetical protein ACSHX6_09250 [Akkermansiaceae bacterium]
MKTQIKRSGLLTVTFLAMTTAMSQAQGETLNEIEKKQLIERLAEIREAAEKSSKDRFAVALMAFRDAIKSDASAHDLYLKCVEKADFEDQKKSSQDFRDWKRKHKERRDTAEFRRALRHQLNWLLLSIEASVKPDEIESLGVKALAKVDAIMEDHKMLKPQQGLLDRSVLSSVYAKAYNINGLQAKDWPLSPLAISDIYEKLVMPPLRNGDSVDMLRKAWTKRIEHEGLILKNWADLPDSGRVGMKKDMEPPKFTKWKEDGYLKLLWEKEMDCYKHGDEKQASGNMLALVTEHIKHKKSLEWTKDFQKLMGGGEGGDVLPKVSPSVVKPMPVETTAEEKVVE